jgi:hypothetical protein
MPALDEDWLSDPALTRFDYVLLRGRVPAAVAQSPRLRPEAQDGEYLLYAVCGSKARRSGCERLTPLLGMDAPRALE